MNGISEGEAWLCPGQGAPPRDIAAHLVADPFCQDIAPFVSDLLAADFIETLSAGDETVLRRNEISALLCVLSDVSAGRQLVRSGREPALLSGYSVGLWAAMHLSGMLDLQALLRVVWKRASLMNETDGARRGAMLAVIGLKEAAVTAACATVSSAAEPVQIANFNCPGQYTLAGSRAAIEAIKPLLVEAKAHKIADVPVQGAWHCPMMAEAVAPFRAFLEGVELSPPRIPVLGNLTGAPLPADADALRNELSDHLAQPVQWNAVVQCLLAGKIGTFVETGYGNTLTKFGMFIDRSVTHQTWTQALKVKA